MSITTGQRAVASDFINKAQANVTPSADAGRVPKLETTGKLHPDFVPFGAPIVRKYELTNIFGDSTTQFDITNPSGTTFRYTWDGVGLTPNISVANVPVGTALNINGQNFNVANNGAFVVTASGVNYFEITNPAGVVESDKTLGTGSIKYCWIKPAGLVALKVQLQAGGGGSAGVSSGSRYSFGGGAGAYTEDILSIAELVNAFEELVVGKAGVGGAVAGAGTAGGNSIFGTTPLLQANGGAGSTPEADNGTGGTVPTAGYLSVNGQRGAGFLNVASGIRLIAPSALAFLSVPANFSQSSCTDCNQGGQQASGFGFGGAPVGIDSQPSGIGGNVGGQGVIILTEYYS